jgi:RNA-directed DNA polymerase
VPTPTFIERKHDLKMLEINDTVSKMRPEWASINWRYINQRVFRIQKAIYKRTKEGGKVHELQRVCTSLFEAKLLAVRRVTQDNSGKKTAGVDGIKSLSPQKRWELARILEIDGEADLIRRVWIPKPNSEEQRPLGIPTIRDRVKQALAMLALEPEWEARFEANSYGFRPFFFS